MFVVLQGLDGSTVETLEMPRMTPGPQVLTWGLRSFMIHGPVSGGVAYREAFTVALDGHFAALAESPPSHAERA